MKIKLILYFFAFTFYNSCSSQVVNTIERKEDLNLSTLDALLSINYFNFYEKPLVDLLDNEYVKQFNSHSLLPSNSNCLNKLYLVFELENKDSVELEVEFSKLQYNPKCLSEMDYWTIDRLQLERIKSVRFNILNPIKIVKTEEEEMLFFEYIRNIDIHKYHGKKISKLFLDYPKLNKYTYVHFSHEENCLKNVFILYKTLDERDVILSLYIKEFKFSEKCINPEFKSWNLNNIKRETLFQGELEIRD